MLDTNYGGTDLIIITLIMALVGALIGWITNVLAIRSIFWPRQPIIIPVIRYTIQGLIPKRRTEIAENIGKIVEEELISIDEVLDHLIKGPGKVKIQKRISQKIIEILDTKIPFFIPSGIKNTFFKHIIAFVERETEKFINEIVNGLIQKANEDIKVGRIVEEKINTMDLKLLEDIVIRIGRKELRHIEILGGILGFIIGVFQGLVAYFFSRR